jgi:predicted dehydrogenase
MNVLKGCVIGFGKLGLLHLSQFQSTKDVEIKYICEENHIICKGLKKIFNNIEVINDYKKVDINNLDFVVVTTPSSTHFEIIKFFISKKIHVFSEKPLVTNYADSLILKKLSLDNKIILFTGYMYDFYDTFSLSRNLLKIDKVIGDIINVKSEMYVSQYLNKKKRTSWRFNKKKSGGGVIITQTSHLIFYLCRILGNTKKINSFLKSIYSENPIEDYAHVSIQFDNNTHAYIDASWSAINYRTPYLKILFEGKNGTLTLTEDKIEIYLLEDVKNYKSGYTKIQIPEIKDNVEFEVAGTHYAKQANYFVNLLKNNQIDKENLDLATETQRIIEEIYNA